MRDINIFLIKKKSKVKRADKKALLLPSHQVLLKRGEGLLFF